MTSHKQGTPTGGRRLTLAEYARRRNGVPLGASGALRNMLHRSFGASTFAGFWRYWNPIFGYALGRFVYAPLQSLLPKGLALILTFVACGAVHDLVTTAIRGSVTLFFSVWFLFMGGTVVLSRNLGVEVRHHVWLTRAAANFGLLAFCLGVTLAVRSIFKIP